MINSQKDYIALMQRIESLLRKSTALGGFENLSKDEVKNLKDWSLLAEQYEDKIPLMPIKKPNTLADMIRFKMYERNLKQKQLAHLLEISEAYISGLLSGKRKISLELAKRLHTKLGIDATFILNKA